MVSGGVIYSLSFLASCFAPTIETLYISFGISVGVSNGFMSLVNFTIIPKYFDKRLGMATGLCQAGVGIGLFTFSALNEYLVKTYGLQGCFLILSALSLHGVAIGMLMVEPYKRKSSRQICDNEMHCEKQPLITDNNNQKEVPISNSDIDNDFHYTRLSESSKATSKETKLQTQDIKSEDGAKQMTDETSKHTFLTQTLGLDILKNVAFTLSVVASILTILPHEVIPTILPDHIEWAGYTEDQGALLLVIIGVANTFSRVCIWNLSKETPSSYLNMLSVSSALSGLSLVFTVYYNEYWMFIALSVLFGITRGVHIIYLTLYTIHIVGKDRVHHGFGISLTLRGFALLIAMPAFGAIGDLTHDLWGYNIVIIALGAAEILASVIFFIIKIRL